ncbi:MAG: ABC transporter permease, partial [Anaerolineales bacterium]
MGQFLLRRLLLAIPVLIGVTFIAYAMLLMTGDPTSALAGEHATPEMRAAIRERYGLDDPIYIQYGRFLSQLFQGELGTSIMTKSPVVNELKLFFPATIELALTAIVLAVLIGVPLGMLAGYKHNTFVDLGTTFGALV